MQLPAQRMPGAGPFRYHPARPELVFGVQNPQRIIEDELHIAQDGAYQPEPANKLLGKIRSRLRREVQLDARRPLGDLDCHQSMSQASAACL